ncbi:hypothetical protein LCGC14_0779450 [marine sediment metagenome]|uniref:Uncharacterized protein n=1 Tax=marine sediment metagenome TaxID=412755 RepID=A0A0F9SFW2_9ZZZZ
MAITKHNSNVEINLSNEYTKIQFICPVCKTKKILEFPKSIISDAKKLTTMSIARGLVCEHQFQAFVDINFQVRGYQRVDFEFESHCKEEKNLIPCNFKRTEEELFENLILEENYLEYKPRKIINRNNEEQNFIDEISPRDQDLRNNNQDQRQKKDIPLQEIYEEFFEFIDDDNEKFNTVIKKNLRLRKEDDLDQLTRKKVTLQEIYGEFWEVIDDNNEKFSTIIKKDLRRKKNPLLLH